MDSSNDEALDIIVTNVVATFRTRCHLNLRTIALEGVNVIYKPEVGKVLMKLRKPKITASIWSSGKVICTGATSEDEAKLGARRLARCLQKLGFKSKDATRNLFLTENIFKIRTKCAECGHSCGAGLPTTVRVSEPQLQMKDDKEAKEVERQIFSVTAMVN
eukprot:superscaffoldBa00002419_g14177